MSLNLLEPMGQAGHAGLLETPEAQKCEPNLATLQALGPVIPTNSNGQSKSYRQTQSPGVSK